MSAAESLDPLVGAIKHRNREALSRFLSKHRERLGDWVRFGLGVPAGRGADHSDALQEVSIKLWQCVGTFEGTTESQLLHWFQRRLRWWVVDLSRKKFLGASLVDSLQAGSTMDGNLLDELPAKIDSPSRFASQAEHEARIRAAAGELTNEQLVVVLLHDVDGVALKEIARHYEASPVVIARQYISAVTALGASELTFDGISDSRSELSPAAALANALRRLPPVERHALLLKHLERFTMEEAADALETTPAAIGSAVYRAMRQLRMLLGQPLPAGVGVDAKQK